MDTEKIIQDLNRRFDLPLPEFYKRRIIFWYDEEREFEDKLDEIQLDNASLFVMTGTNTFELKKLLAIDDTTTNYLIYCPISYETLEDNWLLNVELYSGEVFRADLNTILMDEIGLQNTQALRKVVKQYHKFFNSKERRNRLSSFSGEIATPTQLLVAIMAVICGVRELNPSSIIKAVLENELDEQNNHIYQSLVNYGAKETFWALVQNRTGYVYQEQDDLSSLAKHIFITAATRTIDKGLLKGLDNYINESHQSFCYDFVSEWMMSSNSQELYVIARDIEDELRLYQRFSKLDIDNIIKNECFPCVNEIILEKLMENIKNNIINVDHIASTVEKRRALVWYEELSCYFEGLLQVAQMQAFFVDHSKGFHIANPRNIWLEYTEDYYKMDSYYRQFHLCFQKSLKVSNEILDDLFKNVADTVENLYSGWFLTQLGNNWNSISADDLKDFGHIKDIKYQEDFYNSIVRKNDNRSFVIISDALRYEVAASLAEQLRRETQSKVSISSMSGIIPTTTPFGMAALLPHKELTVENKSTGLVVLADGQSTESANRENVLKSADSESVALQYKNIIGLKRADRQALVKGKNVVYIYHNCIDEAAHTSDVSVFSACEEAIDEIKNLVRIIVNEFSGAHIYITADHGFLYTYKPLSEDEKISKSNWNSKEIECGKRYVILERDSAPDYMLKVKLLNGNADFDTFVPLENVRIKTNGGGLHFVHGGTSLQEMVVPLIEYHFLRNDSVAYKRNKSKIDTKPVELGIISASRKISNMIFSLNFYQKDAVGGNREAANYSLYFTDSANKVVSDVCRIIADKTSENTQDRTFHCNFNLKSLKFDNKETYYLVIEDESGLQLPVREEYQIDITFAVDDFGF